METRYLFGSVKLNEKEKEYIKTKIAKSKKLLKKYPQEEIKASVEISQDRHMFWEIVVMIATPKKKFRTKKSDSDLFRVVDLTEEALLKQIRRSNEKTRDTIRNRKRGK